MVDKNPIVIARCADARDIAIALREATGAGLPVSVRGGGHQIAGGAVVDNGVVIDLSDLRYADVDPVRQTVACGGGALLGDLDRALARHHLAVPAGVVSHTGVGGLTLGGGIGWLSRSRGLTCDALIGATVVDGNGRLLDVDDDHHPDLFWALRGGGGSFGVVAEFRFRAAPIGTVTFGVRTVPLDRAREALLEYGDVITDLPRELQVMVKLQKVEHPQEADGIDVQPPTNAAGAIPAVTFEWLWSGDPAQAGRVAELLELGGLGHAHSTRQKFGQIQSQQDHRYPHGRLYYLKPGHLNTLGEAQVDALVAAADDLPSGDSQVEMLLLGGAITDVTEDDTAYPKRSAGIAFNVTAGWQDPADTPAHVGWARQTHAALDRLGPAGAYINFLGSDKPDLAAVFGSAKLDRLRAVKRIYDPADLFQPMVHISPEVE
jgi:FAD/FMN-containing dehydrogenase